MDLAHAPTLARSVTARDIAIRPVTPAMAGEAPFRAQWDALVDLAAEPNPYFEPWFLLPSLAHLAGPACTIAAAFEGDQLIGLLPLARPRRYYGYPVPHVATWLHDNAFCGAPLVARGFERGFWQALLGWLDRAPGTALLLHLPQLPVDGIICEALDAVLADQARASATVEFTERAMLASALDSEAYLESAMTAKKRKELRRQHKRLAEEGVLTFERTLDAQAIDQWTADFLALEAAGWKGEAGSALASAETTRRVFADALMGGAQAGRLERLTLRLDGLAIAMLASFITPPGAFSFKTAFDERYARFSPGLLLQLENLALLDRPDIHWADSCAVQGHSMIERLWREKRAIASRNIAIGGGARRAAFAALMAYETRNRSAA